jgi:hypothetical protein
VTRLTNFAAEMILVCGFGLALLIAAPLIGKVAADRFGQSVTVAADFPSVAMLPIPQVRP